MPDERWEKLDRKAKAAGSTRTKAINDMAAWYVNEEGAKLPKRPDDE